MTFGVGSPGFDPFWCPPCNEGVCNVVCADPIDFPLMVLGLVGLISVVSYLIRKRYEMMEGEEA